MVSKYKFSTLVLAQGVLRKNFKLDLIVGLFLKQLIFTISPSSSHPYSLYKYSTISALTAKSLKEVTYHLRHSSQWMIRLGDGTKESHQRIVNAIDELWMFTGDMFAMDEIDRELMKKGVAADLERIKSSWDKKVKEVFTEATLSVPENVFMIHGSREGKHTEYLGHILAEMQSLPRMYPNAQW